MTTEFLKYKLIIIFNFIIFLSIILAAPISQIPRLECYGSTYQVQPYPNICNIFYECKEKQMYVKICTPGQNFNPILGICDFSRPNNCLVAAHRYVGNKFCPLGYVGTIPNPNDCSKFTACTFGKYQHKVCENGSVYNDVNGLCDDLNNVPECSADMKRNNTLNRKNHYLTQLQTKQPDDEPEPDDTNTIDRQNYEKFMAQVFASIDNQLRRVQPIVSTTPAPNVERSHHQQNIWLRHW